MTELIMQQESAKAIKAFAYKALRRCHAAGDRTIELDDIMSELWFAYQKACENYDPTTGVPFLAYLRNGMRLYINRFIDNNVTNRHAEVVGTSLDASYESDEGGSLSIANVLASADPTPDQLAEAKEFSRRVSRMVSEDTALFLSLLVDPPQMLLHQVRQITARADYARSQGMPAYATNHLTFAVIIEAMGASRTDRARFLQEINSAVAMLNGLAHDGKVK